jgi:hypothetical protein
MNENIKLIIDVANDYGDMTITEAHAVECNETITIDGGMDTLDRERVMDYFAQYVTGMEWPTYGVSEESKTRFNELMIANAPSKGILLGDEWSK